MHNKIIIRPLKKQDFLPLLKIIRYTWKFDDFSSPQIAQKLSKYYLYSYLSDQTDILVAEILGKTVGIIMGKNISKYKIPRQYALQLLYIKFCLLFSKEGRAALKVYKGIEKLDNTLLSRTKQQYDAELSFFVVDEAYRGKGIGKTLYQNMINLMKKENLKNFYLYTDTESTYKFYEKRGMKLQHQINFTLNFYYKSWTTTFFIYDQTLVP